MSNDLVVVQMDRARTALIEAKTLSQVKSILDMAAAAKVYAQRQRLGEEAVRYATEVRLDAERKLGEMLRVAPKNKGALSRGSQVAQRDKTPTLDEIGIDRKTSARAQQLAALPAETFQQVKAGEKTIAQAKHEAFGKPEPKPAKPKEENPELVAAQTENVELKYELEQLRESINESNITLKAEAALICLEGDPAKEIVSLNIKLRAAESVRDDFMRQCGELRKQVKYLERKLTKMAA